MASRAIHVWQNAGKHSGNRGFVYCIGVDELKGRSVAIRKDTTLESTPSSGFVVAVSGAVFLAVLLILNRDLFRVPIFEYTDFAANALQVERAKHFRELLGNYSRWGFHHPGPGFFYIFAFGERVLHDWLHLVPSEMNAHILSMVVLNTAFLFGAIGIIARHCRSRLFPPAALALSLFFIYLVNRTIPGSAIFSIWMPHVLLFCFLFFVTVCASVAVGRTSHIPWLAFSGLMLIHGHVAQPLFVGPLSVAALGTVWWRDGRAVGWREFLRQNRKPFAISVVLILLFAFPIVLDVAIHRDNNIRAILHHAEAHKGMQQSFMQSLKYEFSFLAFIPNPEVVLKSASAHLISKGWSKPYVAAYWILGWLMVGLAVAVQFVTRQRISCFIRYAAFEIVLVSGLFYYWTLKMTGPLFTFNGYFFFSIQLLALLLLVCLILDGLHLTVRPVTATILCVLLPLSMFGAKQGFLNTEKGEPETNRLVVNLPPADGKMLHLTFDSADWMIEAGVASRLQHEHRQFCVDDLWAFTFGRDHRCPQFAGLTNLILTHTPEKCEAPCRVLTKDDHFEFEWEPYPELRLPFAITLDDLSSLNKGFNEFLGTGGPVWAKGHATIYFRLAPDFGDTPKIQVGIFGTANPERPVKIFLNDHLLGTIVSGEDSADFIVDRSLLSPGENRLVIQVDNPLEVEGDPQNDPRVLGFQFVKAEFEPIAQ
jgi:hypothetical protein